MKFTLSWLKDYLDTDASVTEISEKLTDMGLEVEEIIDPSASLNGFVVAEVVSAEKHPDADRLQVLSVTDGTNTYPIVCGAPNARAGLKGILAVPGTMIPSFGEKLKKGKIRGVESLGMMCSERELLIGDNHDGIIDLPADAPVGAKAADVLPADPIFDIAITPNRAEALAVRGIARDLAAGGMGSFKDKPVPKTASSFDSPVSVSFDFPAGTENACPYFVGRTIKGIKNGESPAWLKDRLTAIGLRPISALVDITNYLCFDRARPLHVFDVDKLSGDIHVRLAKEGETLEALDEESYKLKDSMIVVCDDKAPQALGGVMGGLVTGCNSETTTVFIESALFDPMRIARTGRDLALDSDSRFRFERHVDPTSCLEGVEFATQMILDICGGEASEIVSAGTEPDWKKTVSFRPSRIAQLCGVDVATDRMEQILTDLGFTVTVTGDDSFDVMPPSWRGDIEGEHDLVEEIIRVHGYDKIPTAVLPRDPMPHPVFTAQQQNEVSVKRSLASRGLLEAITWSFMSSGDTGPFLAEGAEPILLSNPISSDLDAMRPSILPNLLAAAKRNIARGDANIALFELGPIFCGTEPGDQQSLAVGIRVGQTGPRHWAEASRDVDVFDAKADLMAAMAAAGAPQSAQISNEAPSWYHPGRSGSLRLGRNVLAYFGEIHPGILKKAGIKETVVAFEFFLDAVPGKKKATKKTRKLLKASSLMPLHRDFAFVADRTVTADALIRAVKEAEKSLIAGVKIFDQYEGEHIDADKKSLAIQVTLQPQEKTLKDKEIDSISRKIVAQVEKRTGAVLRG